MTSQVHRPYYRGSSCICADCGLFLFDVRTGARLRALKDVDPIKLAAVEHRFSFDPELAQRLVDDDPREVVSTYKLADKFNDFLQNPKARPDLQTPEAQAFLKTLRRWHSPKTDALMPWITREWKKGRIQHGETGGVGDVRFEAGPDYEHEGGKFHRLSPTELEHWADWYQSDHSSRQGKDIMQMKTPEMHQTIKDWDTDMREKAGEASQTRGDIVHSYPDGWTVQKLTTPKQLEDEGESMGHCVGSYARPVEEGQSLIYSLRDHHNEPHATWEISPNQWEIAADGKRQGEILNPDNFRSRPEQIDWVRRGLITPRPHRGTMEQVQGKGNEPPIPEYQKRIKDYFEKTMPDETERPTWEPQHYDDPEYLIDPDDGGYVAYHPGEYGLVKPETTYDWPRIIDYALGEAGGHSESPADELTQKAVEHGQFKPFAQEAEKQIALGREQQRDKMQEEFDAWWEREGEPNAFEHGEYSYPDEEQFFDPETGKYDRHALDQAEEEAQKQRDETQQWAYEEYKNNYHEPQQDMHDYMDALEVEIAAQQYKEGTANALDQVPTQNLPPTTSSTKRSPHAHFSTGEPCRCTFAAHLGITPRTAKIPVCEVCGDPLEHGQCKRCDWGQWSNAMGDGDQNPTDPTREFHPSIQASTQRWRSE